MTNSLRVLVFFVSITIALTVLYLLKKGRIPLKFSLLWFFASLVIFFVAVFPNFVTILTNLLGFQTIANMVTGLLIVVLFFITISLTVIVSGQKAKIQLLIQELSLLKYDSEKKKGSMEDEF